MIDPVADPAAQGGQTRPEPARISSWLAGRIDEQPAVIYGSNTGQKLFSIHCDERGGIVLRRHGVVATGGVEMMRISIGSERRQLALNELETAEPTLQAMIPYNDELITRLRSFEGRIGVSAGDGPPLDMPSDGSVRTLVRTCARNG